MIHNRVAYLKEVITLVMIGVVLGGCSTTSPKVSSEGFETSLPPYMVPPPKQNGSIFQAGYEVSLYEDIRARRVGDILTVILTERTDASKQASTSTAKDSSYDLANPTILGGQPTFDIRRPFGSKLPNRSLETSFASENAFSGEGDSAQSNSLTGNITVTVAEVFPNGNLMIKGQKRLTINQGDEYVQFSGIVRPADINPDNTIQSTKVADAKIAYIGDGLMADINSQGWLTRFFNSKWWPF